MKFDHSYTLSGIARKIGRSRVELQCWAGEFDRFLPSIVAGGTTLYKQDSLRIFSLIAKMKDENQSNEFIELTLTETLADNDGGKADTKKTVSDSATQSDIEQLTAQMDRQRERIDEITDAVMLFIQSEVCQQTSAIAEELTKRVDDLERGVRTQLTHLQEQIQSAKNQISDITEKLLQPHQVKSEYTYAELRPEELRKKGSLAWLLGND